jgi:FKBP-type peptidyl-prolyl cis-trans isomerase FkpA
MLRKSLLLWPAIVASAIGLNACNQAANFAKTKSGIEYKIFDKDGKAKTIKPETAEADYKKNIGQIIALHVEYHTAKDSVLFQSRKQQMGYPVRVPLQEVARKGGLEEAISLLQPGDSGVFRFNADSLSLKTTGQPAPPQIKKHGNTMTLFVKVAAIQSQADAMAAQQKAMQEMQTKMKQHEDAQKPLDAKVIEEYVQKNNLKTQQTPSGLHYIVTQPGTGAKPQKGETVSVQYRGTLLSGKEFDSSAKGNGGKPIDFPLGMGAVIPGWDEGIALLSKGSKAVFLIPSGLAYGQRGAGADIPADAVLRFDVELVDIKPAPPAPPMGMMPGGMPQGAPQGAPQGR